MLPFATAYISYALTYRLPHLHAPHTLHAHAPPTHLHHNLHTLHLLRGSFLHMTFVVYHLLTFVLFTHTRFLTHRPPHCLYGTPPTLYLLRYSYYCRTYTRSWLINDSFPHTTASFRPFDNVARILYYRMICVHFTNSVSYKCGLFCHFGWGSWFSLRTGLNPPTYKVLGQDSTACRLLPATHAHTGPFLHS